MSVHCVFCDSRYETALPAQSVEWVRRCRVCGRRGLEVVPQTSPGSSGREGAEPAEADVTDPGGG